MKDQHTHTTNLDGLTPIINGVQLNSLIEFSGKESAPGVLMGEREPER